MPGLHSSCSPSSITCLCQVAVAVPGSSTMQLRVHTGPSRSRLRPQRATTGPGAADGTCAAFDAQLIVQHAVSSQLPLTAAACVALRRVCGRRSGLMNLAPTSTGSATAIALIFPELKVGAPNSGCYMSVCSAFAVIVPLGVGRAACLCTHTGPCVGCGWVELNVRSSQYVFM